MKAAWLFIQDVVLWIKRRWGWLSWPIAGQGDGMVVNPASAWKVNVRKRLSACDNRPGLGKIYVTVLDEKGVPLSGVKARFGIEASQGRAYDHPDTWGLTDERGCVEWDHLGVPARYLLWMEGDEIPLIENIRTDLGYEYCEGWRPVNRPGVYSYQCEIQRKGAEEQYQAPIASDVQIKVVDAEEDEGYAGVTVTCRTDRVCQVQARWGVVSEGVGPGGDLQEVCDPFSAGGFHGGIIEPGTEHYISLGDIWYSHDAPIKFCLTVVAWEPQYRDIPRCYGISPTVRFTVP